MKFSRISRKLPVGVTIHTGTDIDWAGVAKETSRVFGSLFSNPVSTSKSIRSNTELTLMLEVPDGHDETVAAVLRDMADELEGRIK